MPLEYKSIFNNCTAWINGKELGQIESIEINEEKDDDICECNVLNSFSGEIQITKFKLSRGLRKLFLELGRLANHDKYIAYKKYLKRVKNRNELYSKLKKLGR